MINAKKCVFMAWIIAMIQSFAYRNYHYENLSSFLIQRLNFGKHYISSGDIVLLAMDMFPVIVFEVVFGVFLYRRFCTASVYYFSRQENRGSWYYKECMKMFGYTMFFFICYAAFHMLTGILGFDKMPDKNSIHILCWCIMLQTLYTFVFVVWINLLAIVFGGHNATVGVMGIQYAFVFLLQMAEHEKEITNTYSWKLYMNPVANVVVAWHSDIVGGNMLETTFQTNFSLVYFLVISIISVGIGGIIITHMDIALENKEVES